MRSLRTPLILTALWFSLACCTVADDAQAIARKTLPSVVLIVTKDAADQPISQGSGFFVRPGLIATNWHVVSDAAKITFSLPGKKARYGAAVKAKDSEHDVAVPPSRASRSKETSRNHRS